MAENPYAAPQSTESSAAPAPTPVDVLGIARYQRCILGCVLANFAIIVLSLAIPQDYQFLGALLSLGVSIANATFVILLGVKVFSPMVGVLLGLVALFPCIGLLSLLLVSLRATSRLRAHGVRVGLLGARQDDLAAQGYLS